jgi:hypothetical protein
VLEEAAIDWLLTRTGRDLASLLPLLDRLDRESLAAQRAASPCRSCARCWKGLVERTVWPEGVAETMTGAGAVPHRAGPARQAASISSPVNSAVQPGQPLRRADIGPAPAVVFAGDRPRPCARAAAAPAGSAAGSSTGGGPMTLRQPSNKRGR